MPALAFQRCVVEEPAREPDSRQSARPPGGPTAVRHLITGQCPLTRATHGASSARQRKCAPSSAPTEATRLQGPATWHGQGTERSAELPCVAQGAGAPGDATPSLSSSPAGPGRKKKKKKKEKFEAWLCKLFKAKASECCAVFPLGGPREGPCRRPSQPSHARATYYSACWSPVCSPLARSPPENRRRRPLGSSHLQLLRCARPVGRESKSARKRQRRGSGAARGRGHRPETSFFGKWGFVFPPPRRLNLTLLTPGATAV